VKIPQGSYDDEALKPAWLPISKRDAAGVLVPAKPVIRCACGDLIGIGLHHVHADGRVTASFYHHWDEGTEGFKAYGPGCGFHETLELDGWTGGEFAPEPR
jgi:hypothetical protein